ncbi:MAG TPA: hypothetical protein VF532_04930 [Candidatus Angelobacter sp.]
MTDLKALAHELLHEAQQSLQEDEGHLNPSAVVITPEENLIFDLEFESDEEREEIYADMIDVAKEQNATAIITVNDIYLDDSGVPARLEGPGWEKLSESAIEAVAVTVSGSGFETWSVLSPYFRRGEQIVFQPAREMRNPGGEVELLGDWTGKAGAA